MGVRICPKGTPMSDVTQILSAIEQGDPWAAERPLPLVYDELRKLAAAKLAREKPGQTLQATALVHEAYVRLVDAEVAPRFSGRRGGDAENPSTKRFSGRVALTLRSHTPRSHALRGNGSPRRSASQIRTQSVHRLRCDAERRNEKRDLPRFTEMVHKNRLVLLPWKSRLTGLW